MPEICLKFSISTLTLRNRSGFQMGLWLGGEQASGHPSPGDPGSLMESWVVWVPSPRMGTGRECAGGFLGRVELGSALSPSLAWHCPTGCSQELSPPQLETSISIQTATDPYESRFKNLNQLQSSSSCPREAHAQHLLQPSQRTPTVSPLTPLCSSTSQAHPANLAEHL